LLEAAAVSSGDALDFGLVDEVVTEGDVTASAIARASGLAARAPLAVASVKQGFRNAGGELEDALAFERNRQPFLFDTADFLEGRKAFYEKREPRFSGR
jgi:enoyl-CoA hydratase/carnithine racemase